MRAVALVALLTVAVPSPTQSKPLSRSDYFAAAARLEQAADRSLGRPVATAAPIKDGQQPVTRVQIIEHLFALYKKYKAIFIRTPRTYLCDKVALEAGLPADLRSKAETLVKWGFLAPVGPLVVGPDATVQSRHAGDALGLFFTQVSLLSYKAEPRWAPQIQPTGGD